MSTYDEYMVNTPEDKSEEKQNENPMCSRPKRQSKGKNRSRSLTSTSGAANNGATPEAVQKLGEDNQATPVLLNGPVGTPAEENLKDMGTFDDVSDKDYMPEFEDDVTLRPEYFVAPINPSEKACF